MSEGMETLKKHGLTVVSIGKKVISSAVSSARVDRRVGRAMRSALRIGRSKAISRALKIARRRLISLARSFIHSPATLALNSILRCAPGSSIRGRQ